ncbi:hypothetical protein EJ03DRAFT_358144 [Teratosphaeria nubilosa]|uniref:Uncharacterized protein n=1 Tax=Teratosphaeria nubilosa TaxID=161662 RepID=A0A6G1KVP0_9PEZI|nr:hypothetical protein EJ03DRAFT_358144 [Teratosphaeria nubilosa]
MVTKAQTSRAQKPQPAREQAQDNYAEIGELGQPDLSAYCERMDGHLTWFCAAASPPNKRPDPAMPSPIRSKTFEEVSSSELFTGDGDFVPRSARAPFSWSQSPAAVSYAEAGLCCSWAEEDQNKSRKTAAAVATATSEKVISPFSHRGLVQETKGASQEPLSVAYQDPKSKGAKGTKGAEAKGWSIRSSIKIDR